MSIMVKQEAIQPRLACLQGLSAKKVHFTLLMLQGKTILASHTWKTCKRPCSFSLGKLEYSFDLHHQLDALMRIVV
jgi:hypothetical protein